MAEISAANASMPEMSISEFVELLKQKQIHIRAEDGRLKISAPAGAVDIALQSELKRRKPVLLKILKNTDATLDLVPLSDQELRERIPLTPAQQGMWLIEHFNPGNVAYCISEAFRLDGEVRLDTLQSAVDRLIARHRILRTSFHEEEGELFQAIAERVEAPVGFTDLSALPAEEGNRHCHEAIRREGRRPFDLKQAPLVRFHLFRMQEHRYVVLINIHHIVADRISLYVIREELVVLSEAIGRTGDAGCDEAEAGLVPVPIQYADYSVWLNRLMRSQEIERQIAAWKKKLAGLPPFIELQHSLPWPEKRTAWGAIRLVTIPGQDAAALKRIGMEEGASPFMTFLAVYAVLIARASRNLPPEGTADFCIGSPITHRRQVATERMIGLFVNMLAFRCTLAPGMSFREVLRQVRGTALEAYENSDVPFQRLVRALKPDRRSQRSPVFQVMFGYETYLPPVAGEIQMDIDPGTARYDLSLHLAESAGDALNGAIEYCTDLFTEGDAAKLTRELEAIVSELARDPEQDIWKLPIAEKARPLDYPAGETAGQSSGQRSDQGPEGSGSVFQKVSRFFSRS
jgi:hypothetical protein